SQTRYPLCKFENSQTVWRLETRAAASVGQSLLLFARRPRDGRGNTGAQGQGLTERLGGQQRLAPPRKGRRDPRRGDRGRSGRSRPRRAEGPGPAEEAQGRGRRRGRKDGSERSRRPEGGPLLERPGRQGGVEAHP